MSSGYEVVSENNVGEEGVASEWKTIRTTFRNFAGLSSKRGDRTKSPVHECHGLDWRIELFPGGDVISSEENEYITLRLASKSATNTKKVLAKFIIRVPSTGISWSAEGQTGGQAYHTFSQNSAWGYYDYAKREDVLDSSKNYLVDGNLTVEVDIQVMLDKPPVWTPTNTISADMLKVLDDNDNADVLFDIGRGSSPRFFYAHRNILSIRCPALAELAEDSAPETPIPIGDVQADVFRMLLRFIYGGEVPSKDLINDQAKDIIRLADRFGCTGLKLTAEAKLAIAGITTDNAAELILFADGTNCAMLKEAAMEFFVRNSQAIMASEGYEQVAESPAIMREMVDAVVSGNKKRPADDSASGNDRDYKRMRVAELRRELDSKGLDVDGSTETLLSRLKAADEEERKKNSITISGAGFDDVNGVYNKTSKIYDGLPVYQKKDGEGSIYLFRCRIPNGQSKWFISFVPDGAEPGTLRDIDYYSADPDDGDDDNDASLPPRRGWNVEDDGLGPSPTVQKSEEE